MALPARASPLRLAFLVVLLAGSVCDSAVAGDALRRSGVVIDKRGVVDPAHWTISESSATWDTPNFTGRYTWSIPSSIPASGANASLTVTSTDKSGGRYNGVIGLSGAIPVEGGPARAEALADKNGGQATKSASASFKLVPSFYCDTCTPSVTVGVQDGPQVTFQYRVVQPPCSVAARFSQEGGSNCKLGKLPVGKPVSLGTPEPGKGKNVSPVEIPPETYGLILEIITEQEGERMAAALAAKYGAREAQDAIYGCVLLAQADFSAREVGTSTRVSGSGITGLFNACLQLLLRAGEAATPGATAAATGCRATVVPMFLKGTKVTKRRRTQAIAAIKRRTQASCKRRAKGMAVSLKARGSGATLRPIVGRRIAAPLARFSNRPANGRRVTVQWKARKR